MLPPILVPPAFDAGSAWLVGAGPGDPGLLALHEAESILLDAVVLGEILSPAPLARHETLRKRADGSPAPQLRLSQIAAGRDPAAAVTLIQDAARPNQTERVATSLEAVGQPVAIVAALVAPGLVVMRQQRLAEWQQTAPMTVVGNQQQVRISG